MYFTHLRTAILQFTEVLVYEKRKIFLSITIPHFHLKKSLLDRTA